MGPGGVPEGSKTADFYRTKDTPERFDNPGLWNFLPHKMNVYYIFYIAHVPVLTGGPQINMHLSLELKLT